MSGSTPNLEQRSHRQTDEAVLLITCLRDLPVIVPPDTDWQALLELATAHGVLLLIHKSFLGKRVAMPAFFTAAVRACRDTAEKFAVELEKLLKHFAERGLEVLPLKGPAQAEMLYGDATMRSSDDLDLLVRREDFHRAEALLSDLGFYARTAADDYHRKFLREGLMVELHFGVTSPRSFPFDPKGIWSRSSAGRFRGQPMCVMSDDDLTLFACLHGLKHGFSRLIWILDVARALKVMQHYNPEELVQKARRRRLEQALLIGCEVVRETLPQCLPQEMEVVIAKSPERAERARQVVARLFAERAGATNDPEIWSLYLQAEWNMRQKWRRRLSFLAPTTEDYAWAERHRIYRFFAPVLRPFRLLHKYGLPRALRILFPPSA